MLHIPRSPTSNCSVTTSTTTSNVLKPTCILACASVSLNSRKYWTERRRRSRVQNAIPSGKSSNKGYLYESSSPWIYSGRTLVSRWKVHGLLMPQISSDNSSDEIYTWSMLGAYCNISEPLWDIVAEFNLLLQEHAFASIVITKYQVTVQEHHNPSLSNTTYQTLASPAYGPLVDSRHATCLNICSIAAKGWWPAMCYKWK